MAVSVVRKGWKDLLFQSRRVHSIEPYITPITFVWSHFPFETEVEKESAFLPEKAEEQYEELLYLFQHQGCELSSHFSFLHLLLLSKSFTQFSGDKPWWSLDICMGSGWLFVSKLLLQ